MSVNEKRDWSWAVKQLREGKNVRRKAWPSRYWVIQSTTCNLDQDDHQIILGNIDLNAEDWELYEEEKKVNEKKERRILQKPIMIGLPGGEDFACQCGSYMFFEFEGDREEIVCSECRLLYTVKITPRYTLTNLDAEFDRVEKEKEVSESVKSGSLLDEEWREYEWHPTGWPDDYGASCTYRINNPKDLVVGSTTHRVVDTDGIVHCVPNVGHMGCVLRWKPRNPEKPIAF